MASVEQDVMKKKLEELAKQRDQLASQLTRLETMRNQVQASLNAVIGAIAVLEELSADAPAEAPRTKGRRRLPNGDARPEA